MPTIEKSQAVTRAVEAIESGRMTIREACEHYGVDRAGVWRRRRGMTSEITPERARRIALHASRSRGYGDDTIGRYKQVVQLVEEIGHYGKVAEKLGISRNAVCGVMYRYRRLENAQG